MKWINVNNNSSTENFELWQEDKKLAVVSFSSLTRIVRFISNFGKRLFFFEKHGLLAHRIIIKNEYGIKMGKVEEEKPGSQKGFLELDGNKYYYIFNRDNSGELEVYDEAMEHSLLHCSFKTILNGFAKTKSLLDTKFPSLLMLVCWYALKPQHAELA
jgi:hypothetical protein